VLLRQRDVTIEQLDAPPVPRRVPTGVVVFGGLGLGLFRDQVGIMCGTVRPAAATRAGLAYTGARRCGSRARSRSRAALMRPPRPSAEGGGGPFVFESQLEPTLVVTVAGKAGVPVGPMRFYGKGGAIYQRSKLVTEQSMQRRR
jgi:hypothetical protein